MSSLNCYINPRNFCYNVNLGKASLWYESVHVKLYCYRHQNSKIFALAQFLLMNPSMSISVAWCKALDYNIKKCKGFSLVWFMFILTIWLWDTLVTKFLLLWLLFGMSPFMFIPSKWESKTLLQMFTLVRFLSGMNHFKSSFATWLWETLPTMFTLEWLLFGMSPNMFIPVHVPVRNSLYNVNIGRASLWYEPFHVYSCGWTVRNSCCIGIW